MNEGKTLYSPEAKALTAVNGSTPFFNFEPAASITR